MSPKKQRIAIAEACGWSDCKVATLVGRKGAECIVGSNAKLHARGKAMAARGLPNWPYEALPDYLHDLNAMREAFMTLTDYNQGHFCQHLVFLCETTATALNATAAQRAEAFLRTVRKWEDPT